MKGAIGNDSVYKARARCLGHKLTLKGCHGPCPVSGSQTYAKRPS